jgi:hypothetical protein
MIELSVVVTVASVWRQWRRQVAALWNVQVSDFLLLLLSLECTQCRSRARNAYITYSFYCLSPIFAGCCQSVRTSSAGKCSRYAQSYRCWARSISRWSSPPSLMKYETRLLLLFHVISLGPDCALQRWYWTSFCPLRSSKIYCFVASI